MNEPLLESSFLERLERLTLHWNRSFPGLVGGHNLSRYSGPGQEFLDHRVFHEGDDLRSVNWRAYMRLEKLFLKMFEVEPRVPVRIMLDTSISMTTGAVPGQPSKFDFGRKLAAALTYIGLVRLDTITLQPFSGKLIDPFRSGGGRHRFQPASDFLARLKPGGSTSYVAAVKQFISEYPQRGLLVVISDFLDDQDCMHPLQYLADFGHELLLIHVWTEEDRRPAGEGEMELTDAETGQVLHLGLDDNSRREYTERFDNHAEEIRRLALRNAGRYVGLSTSLSIEECIFGSLVRAKGVA